MIEMTERDIQMLKAGIADYKVLAYIQDLERENDRLHSHHSACKEELGGLALTAQRWRVRAYVAEKLAGYLNSIHPFWTVYDLKAEIAVHVARIMEKVKRRENWWKEEEATWNSKGAREVARQ